jgi:hypothetical protein
MAGMNGKTAIKILRNRRTKTKIEPMITIAVEMEMVTIIVVEKKISAPKEVDGNPLEKGIENAVIAGPGATILIPVPKKSTIVFTVAMKRMKKRKRLVQKS